MWDMDNIRAAHHNARKGKLHYREVKMVDADPEEYLGRIQAMLRDKTFCNSTYKVFVKRGRRKDRVIHKLPYYPDRIVHHCIVQVLEPIWMAGFISDTLACIKGRGIHRGAAKIKHALRDDTEGTRYCLKMDVRKFYPSMDHHVLKGILARKIKDPDVMWLLGHIIGSTEAGVPIGNYLSQYFGNVYLSGLDHWAKEVLNHKYYIRYCDDIVILGPDKPGLHETRRKIEAYMRQRLKLSLKDNWQIFPVAIRGTDFLGYRFYPGYTLLRKSTAIQFRRSMANLKDRWQRMPPISVLSAVMSYYGWMRHANCLRLWHKYIDEEIRSIVAVVCDKAGIADPLERRSV